MIIKLMKNTKTKTSSDVTGVSSLETAYTWHKHPCSYESEK